MLTNISTSDVWALAKLCLPSKSQSCSRMQVSTSLLLFSSGDWHGWLRMILNTFAHRVHQHAASHSWCCKVKRIGCDSRRLLVQTILQILWRILLVLIHSILRTASLNIRLNNLGAWRIILNSVDLWIGSAQDCLRRSSHWHCLRVSHTMVSSETWIYRRRSTGWEGWNVVWIYKFTRNEFKQVAQSIVIFNKEL